MSDRALTQAQYQELAQQAAQQIEDALAARETELFEQTSESGLCKASVNLRGRLVAFHFLSAGVLRQVDRETLAEDAISAIRSAQDQAAEAAGAIAADVSARLGIA